jgi:hypothetical protein
MVTERLPHFSGWHWTRYPRRTFRGWSLAIRDGHETARAALDAADAATIAAQLPPVEIDADVLAAMTSKERLYLAFGAIGELSVPKALAVLKDKGAPIDGSTAYQIRKALAPSANGDGS